MGVQIHGWSRRAAGIVTRAFLLSMPVSSGLSAQVVVRGVLYNDSTGVPVRGTVMLVDPASDGAVVHVVSDSLGQFSLSAPSGLYQIAAVGAGYTSTLSAPIPLQNGERLTVRVPIAVSGDPRHSIGVTEHVRASAGANAASDGLPFARGFDDRHNRSAPGLRYGREEFARSGRTTVGGFLQGVPGISVVNPSSTASMRLSRNTIVAPSGSQSAASCHVAWFVDGHRMDFGGVIDPSTDGLGAMELDIVDGIEVFRGVSEVPSDLARPDVRCGAIAIWTRRR